MLFLVAGFGVYIAMEANDFAIEISDESEHSLTSFQSDHDAYEDKDVKPLTFCQFYKEQPALNIGSLNNNNNCQYRSAVWQPPRL